MQKWDGLTDFRNSRIPAVRFSSSLSKTIALLWIIGVLLTCVSLFGQTRVTVSGTVFDAGGNPATSGTVEFDIQPQSSGIHFFVPGVGVISPQNAICGITNTGQLVQQVGGVNTTNPCLVWGNDVISPSNTTYTELISPNGVLTNQVSQLCITGTSFSINNPQFCPVSKVVPQYNTIVSPQVSSNLIPTAGHVFTMGNALAPYLSLFADSSFIGGNEQVGGTIQVGGQLPANAYYIQPHAPLPASWILDMYSPQYAVQSLFNYTKSSSSFSCLHIDNNGFIYNTGADCGTGTGSGTVTTFTAPSASWPSWLVPNVVNNSSTPQLTVAAGPIPNAALANPSTTVDGTPCTLGSTCTTGFANFPITTGTSSLTAGSCTSYTATPVTGLLTTSVILPPTPTTDVSSTTGWTTGGGLGFSYYVSAGNFNWRVCNGSGSTVVPGASVTWNVGAR